LGERATAWHVLWTAVGILGVVVVVLGGDPKVHSDPLGVFLAIAANLAFVFYYVMNRRLRSTTDIDAVSWMVGITLFAGLTITPIALFTTSVSDFKALDAHDWFFICMLSVSSGVIGHTMMSWVHKFIAASRSSLYVLGMNVVSVAAAWPIHHEPVTIVQAIGGIIVLGAVAAVVVRPASLLVELEAMDSDIAATTGYPVKG
jgi:drug/metabolite transporter (DMT)-like permease